ncbi:MAG: hypothetical protein GX359_01075, partial [Clostridiales bacterium]|nr:hypothetical protein [Clostridiales bacterium]
PIFNVFIGIFILLIIIVVVLCCFLGILICKVFDLKLIKYFKSKKKKPDNKNDEFDKHTKKDECKPDCKKDECNKDCENDEYIYDPCWHARQKYHHMKHYEKNYYEYDDEHDNE